MPIGESFHDHPLTAAERAGDLEDIAHFDLPVGLDAVAVQRNLAALARALRLRPGLEEARDIEPDVKTDGFGIHVSRTLYGMRWITIFVLAAATTLTAASAVTPPQAAVTTPAQQFGHDFGDDYFLANYQQLSAYWQKLDRESDRMVLQSIGKTAEGRDQLMAIVTSPENHRNLARYKEISRRLALAEGLSEAEARALAREGKAVVWIDGGLHATETLGAQQLGEMIFRMVSRTDDETMRILNDTIILFVHANPDGNDLVADWYMRHPDPAQRSLANLPRLYQKYIGHDNNRDFFGSTQAETENMNRVLYREWFPQILYNHHQSGPAGTVLWAPPLRDPFNYNQDPLIPLGIQALGVALQTRLAAEGKPGATSRSGGPYDGWWNGGIRNTAAFHNTIAILTEMIGSPTPMRVPLVMDRQLPTSDSAYPVPPQEWKFRRSIDYSVSCNLAILDLASKMRENFLYNRYVMGKNSIERGSTDTWTAAPHRYAAIQAEVTRGAGAGVAAAGASAAVAGGGRGGGRGGANEAALWAALRRPADRDPRAYILSSTQRDFTTATRFINALLETGIKVHRAPREFQAAGKTYPANSFVVVTAQAFRPHVIDMFEPQDHPDNFPSQGAAPTRPYDNAGWTLAFQMGIEFDRVLDAFTVPADFSVVTDWNVAPPSVALPPAGTGTGFYTMSPMQIDSFVAANRLLAAGIPIRRMGANGDFVVEANNTSLPILRRMASERGVRFQISPQDFATGGFMAKRRVGLWDQFGGSMDSGWARWILEQFEFPFSRVFPPELDAGNLNAKYDTLIFVDGSIPASGGGGGGRGGGAGGGGAAAPPNIPEAYRNQIGSVSADRTIPQLRAFVEQGGTIVAIGASATNLGRHFGLPIESHLVENGQTLTSQKFYVPGSVVRARIAPIAEPDIAAGLQPQTDFFFDNSPVWKPEPIAAAPNMRVIASFDSKTPLRSGWAWGQHYLDRGVIAVDAVIGKGRVVLFAPEILQRGQPHATFKLLFNSIYLR